MNQFAAAGRGLLAALVMVGLLGTGAAAQQLSDVNRGIEVSGIGQVNVAPDEATIFFAVESYAATSDEAARQNADTMEQVIAALVAAGIPREEIETRNFSVYPEYDQDRSGEEPRIRGYRVSNQVMMKTRELDRVGALIDNALGAGANRMDGINFGLSDSSAAEQQALRQAVQQARTVAQTLADELGVSLGPVVRASTSSYAAPPMPYMARGMVMESAAVDTPIQPGQQTVRAQVQLVFTIGQ